MKGFGMFAVCALMYILIIILLQVCDGYTVGESPTMKRAVSSFDVNQQKAFGSGSPKTPDDKSATNSTLDFFQITDPTMRSAMNAVYGAMQGNNDCLKKTLCISGNYLQNLPGRDFIFMFVGRYVPTEWVLLYDIFRVSAMYGQPCDGYQCTPHE